MKLQVHPPRGGRPLAVELMNFIPRGAVSVLRLRSVRGSASRLPQPCVCGFAAIPSGFFYCGWCLQKQGACLNTDRR